MDTGCINRVYSEDYQDYIVEYTGFPGFLERQFGNDCFHFVTNKYAVAYYAGKEVQSDVNGGAYIVPHCYGLMSSSQVLEITGVARVQRQPALSLYGNGVIVGFIDTGYGVCCNILKGIRIKMKNENYYNEVLRVIEEVKKAVIGKDDCVFLIMAAILAGGHILVDDIPGVGKTTLAIAFAKSMALENKRTQFTPDVLPSDILGFTMYNKEDGHFYYQPGTVMCNLFLADEINRTSPKTQSALLEVMEESCVTVDGITRKVPEPFIVIATQNPAGSTGTQLLPESQLDRFMVCLHIGYPSLEDEIAIAKGKSNDIINLVDAVIDGEELLNIRRMVKEVYIKDEVYKYICLLARETRVHPMIELGLSPRGTIALASMSKAVAFLRGRDYVVPDDTADIFNAVAAHRIMLSSKARISKSSAEEILGQIKTKIKKPRSVRSII